MWYREKNDWNGVSLREDYFVWYDGGVFVIIS